jgi:hypothetical protein
MIERQQYNPPYLGMQEPITESWLRSLGFEGGPNHFGPSCGRTWTRYGLKIDCYLQGDGTLLAWCDLRRGEDFSRQWQIVHLCRQHNVPLIGIE